MLGTRMTSPDGNAKTGGFSEHGKSASGQDQGESLNEGSGKSRTENATQSIPGDAAQQQIIRNLREAMSLPKETRTRPLLKALEDTTKLPLSKKLLDVMREIIDAGDVESSHYLMSLMEQREEKASVEMLLHAAGHQNPDIADRALFALEAVAGTVFKNHEEAQTWAARWKPDPERAKLFAPVPENEQGSPEPNQLRMPGPGGLAPKSPEPPAE